jgi:hypothetical protein
MTKFIYLLDDKKIGSIEVVKNTIINKTGNIRHPQPKLSNSDCYEEFLKRVVNSTGNIQSLFQSKTGLVEKKSNL